MPQTKLTRNKNSITIRQFLINFHIIMGRGTLPPPHLHLYFEGEKKNEDNEEEDGAEEGDEEESEMVNKKKRRKKR